MFLATLAVALALNSAEAARTMSSMFAGCGTYWTRGWIRCSEAGVCELIVNEHSNSELHVPFARQEPQPKRLAGVWASARVRVSGKGGAVVSAEATGARLVAGEIPELLSAAVPLKRLEAKPCD